MLNANALLNNLFRTKDIMVTRLYLFGVVYLAALKLSNSDGRFDAIISLLDKALDDLQTELGDVETNLSGQKVEIRTVDQFIYDFYNFMSASEPFTTKALGGRNAAGYLAFYPNKQSEYSNAIKTNMQMLTDRVARAAKKWGGSLDADMNENCSRFRPILKSSMRRSRSKSIP